MRWTPKHFILLSLLLTKTAAHTHTQIVGELDKKDEEWLTKRRAN